MTLIGLLVLVVVLAIVFWLLTSYVLPLLPPVVGRVLLAVLALVAVLWLLGTFLGWGWTGVRLR